MSASAIASKHWQRIISRWPIDKVRPENVSFQKLMQQRLKQFQDPPKATDSIKTKIDEAQALQMTSKPVEASEIKQINAVYALLENRFARESPLASRLRHPASDPTYYDNILAEAEQAPNRGMWDNISNKLKGMIRFKP